MANNYEKISKCYHMYINSEWTLNVLRHDSKCITVNESHFITSYTVSPVGRAMGGVEVGVAV